MGAYLKRAKHLGTVYYDSIKIDLDRRYVILLFRGSEVASCAIEPRVGDLHEITLTGLEGTTELEA